MDLDRKATGPDNNQDNLDWHVTGHFSSRNRTLTRLLLIGYLIAGIARPCETEGRIGERRASRRTITAVQSNGPSGVGRPQSRLRNAASHGKTSWALIVQRA